MVIDTLSKRNVVMMLDDVFTHYSLNIQIIRADHANYIIDTGLGSHTAQDILKLVDDTKPNIVINTHSHWDHVWGNAYVNAQWIFAHTNTYEAMKKTYFHDLKENTQYVRGDAQCALPNVLFDKTVHFKADGIILGYAPGHTDQDIYVYDSVDKILNVGDNIGDTMTEYLPELECDPQTYKQSIEHYLNYDITHIVSGHNQLCDASFLDKILEVLTK